MFWYTSGLTWYTSAQSDKDDGSDSVLDTQRAAEVRSHITDDCCYQADAYDWYYEADVATSNV